jgi:hypothetical protein
MLKKKWTLVAVGLDDEFSKALAETWNYGGAREWFWTRRGAKNAARFHSMLMPVGMKPVHADDLEVDLAVLAPRP